ncbi:MAG TPA: hypothetical protein VK902_01950 [Rubrobacter sp.]|nr:hypothetical protein [Rubrobacter sp.]
MWARRELGGKLVWDWLQLPVGPLAQALIEFWLTMQHIRHQRIENLRTASKRTIEEQRTEQATVQTYLDQMGMLSRRSPSAQRERELRSEEDGASEDADGAWTSTNT